MSTSSSYFGCGMSYSQPLTTKLCFK